METWRKEFYLAHHGILGMRWGKRNGPPYPLGASDHSSSEKKAGWRKSLKDNFNRNLKKKYGVTTSDLKLSKIKKKLGENFNKNLEKKYGITINKTAQKMNEQKKIKYSIGDKLKISSSDSSVTKKVKEDYNRMSDAEFQKKYHCTKKVYMDRVNKYGDPYMNSPLAKIGKALEARKKANKEKAENKEVDKALKTEEKLNKDIKSFDSIRNGLQDKKGRDILTKEDVDSIVKGLQEQRLNSVSKTDHIDRGKKETQRIMNELSKDYTIFYDISSKKYSLKQK